MIVSAGPDARGEGRRARNLVFIADGTFASLAPGWRTNCGILYRLLSEVGRRRWQLFDYDPGIQGRGALGWFNAATGMGINLAICRGYGFLAGHWQPGDRIFLFGYSRGAYAVRSLAGMIARVGLLRAEHAVPRNIRRAFRLYQRAPELGRSGRLPRFREAFCHGPVEIEMVGVWDTVRALGLPYPVLSRLAGLAVDFHDDALGPHVRHGYHALAIDEDRTAFAPILWRRSPDWQGRLEQVWFPGAHGDVGGDVRGRLDSRPLANIPLAWMLRRAIRLGLVLPAGWESRFLRDPAAPSVGNRRGINRLFLLRRPRVTGLGDNEAIHLSVAERMRRLPDYRPVASALPPS